MINSFVKLTDVCRIQYGFAFDSSKFSERDGTPLVRIRDVVRGYSETFTTEECGDEYLVQNDDMLIGMDGEFNISHWKGGKAYLNQRVCHLIPKDVVDALYLFYFMPKALKEIEDKTPYVTVKHLSAKELNKIIVPMPTLEEQKQIGQRLQKVDSLISLRKQQLAKLNELVKSRFVEMFGGISDSKKYPYKAVKELTDVISGGTPSREVNEYWEGGTIPWVKTTELQNNIITEIDEHITEAGLDNSSAKLVPAGTVLIAMYGQGKTRGMTGYLGVEACTNQACACILPSNNINQKFLWQFFVLSYDNLRDMAKGGNQPNLNGNIIKNYPVLYPPMEMQEQFASLVEQTDKSKLTIQQSLEKLELLKKALMQKYFG